LKSPTAARNTAEKGGGRLEAILSKYKGQLPQKNQEAADHSKRRSALALKRDDR
jgi:hypothetical protein